VGEFLFQLFKVCSVLGGRCVWLGGCLLFEGPSSDPWEWRRTDLLAAGFLVAGTAASVLPGLLWSWGGEERAGDLRSESRRL